MRDFQNLHILRNLCSHFAVEVYCLELIMRKELLSCVLLAFVLQGDKKRTLSHLHFREWPDFGVPQSTDVMIHFCQTMRHHALAAEVGLILVHCRCVLKTTILRAEHAPGIDPLHFFFELLSFRHYHISHQLFSSSVCTDISNVIHIIIISGDEHFGLHDLGYRRCRRIQH